MAAIALAGVIGNPVSGAIMDVLSGKFGLAGWQWLFLAEGIPSIIVGFWVISYLDSSIEEAKWLTAEEKSLLARNIEAEDRHKTQHSVIAAFKSAKVYVLCVIYFTLMIGLYGIAFLSIGTLGVVGSMPLFWPIPSAFLAGTAAAAGIGIVNSVGNLGGYVGPNVTIWVKGISSDPSAALYTIALILVAGAITTLVFIPKDIQVRSGSPVARGVDPAGLKPAAKA